MCLLEEMCTVCVLISGRVCRRGVFGTVAQVSFPPAHVPNNVRNVTSSVDSVHNASKDALA